MLGEPWLFRGAVIRIMKFYTQELDSSFFHEKAQGNHPLLPGVGSAGTEAKSQSLQLLNGISLATSLQHRKEWDSHSQREMICPLKPNYNWLNSPSPNLVPEVKWRRQEDVLLSGLAVECCWVGWSDGEFPSFWGECHILAEGEGREQRPFDGSLRRETTLYLT